MLQWWPLPVPPPRVPVIDERTHEAQLAFPSAGDRAQGQAACQAKVLEGCTAGLRAACSVQAARQCGPPPLLRLLGLAPEQAWEEREACEALCMSACLEQRTPACQQHAAAFCADAFAGPAAGGDLRPIGGGGGKKR